MLKKKYFWIFVSLLGFSLVLSACNIPNGEQQNGNLIPTHVAQTVTARVTEQPAFTSTPKQSELTATVTSTPQPSATPTQTATTIPCEKAVFLEHVTVPLGAYIERGAGFVKTWRVFNAGSCTWTTASALEFVSGTAMGASARVPLSKSVAPGETADLTIAFTAPTSEGTHNGYWALVNESGVKIPMDNIDTGNLQVSIWINVLDTVVYDFTKNKCDARWQSVVDAFLKCPGDPTVSAPGYVIVLEEGKLEDGTAIKKEDDSKILVTRPDNGDSDGFISGTFPALKVQTGDHFLATIGCARGANECNLFFDLKYQIGNGAIHTLKTWQEVYEGKVRKVSVDLSSLAGESVKFILMVRNNQTDKDNQGYWFEPVIMR